MYESSPGILVLGALGAIAVLGLLVGLGIILSRIWTEYSAPGRPAEGLDPRIVRIVVDPSAAPDPDHALVGGVAPPPGVRLAMALL